jgi:hypothetical protein
VDYTPRGTQIISGRCFISIVDPLYDGLLSRHKIRHSSITAALDKLMGVCGQSNKKQSSVFNTSDLTQKGNDVLELCLYQCQDLSCGR